MICFYCKEKLIALIVTIIVLLILAGVTIATLVGENGILTRANNASKAQIEGQVYEKIKLAVQSAQIGNNGYQELTIENLGQELIKDGTKAIVSNNEDNTIHILFLDEKKEYKLYSDGNIEDLNINFSTKYVAPSSQNEERNEGVIGIGTGGKIVDMDLWEYTLLEDGTYGLNDKNVFIEEYVASSGYNNNNLINDKIQGTIPQYIKTATDKEFVAVTNINYLFYNTDLSEAPIIPNTVISMRGAFNACSKLTSMPSIPNGVINMYGSFAGCSNLTQTTEIPNSVIDMYGTFSKCISLKSVQNISNNVTNISRMFVGCTSLIASPEIPNNVTNMDSTFYECTSLATAPKIPNSVTNMKSTFVRCTSLIIAPKIPNSVTNMQSTFYECTSLITAPEISNNVTNMYTTFYGCTSLTTAPKIPNSVIVLCAAFKNCSNLEGIIEINANVTGKQLGSEYFDNIDYFNCLVGATTNEGKILKVTGNCTVLKEIVENAKNSNIRLQ